MEYRRRDAIYSEIDHTADVGIIAEGDSLTRLFANAAFGMIFLIIGERNPAENIYQRVHLTENSIEELMISWLGEINFKITMDNFTMTHISDLVIGSADNIFSLDAQIMGGRLKDPGLEIKAVTYHQFYIKELGPDHFQTRIIFDI
jgi:SHS2 domain-containing protein